MRNLFLFLFVTSGIIAQTNRYVADTAKSTIYWKGFKPGGSQHGTLNIQSGYLTLKDGKIAGGSFVIDMNSISVHSIPADDKMNQKLVNHLKSEDFFEVETYPYATFIITGGIERENETLLKGSLLMKKKSNPVNIPAVITISGNSLSIKSEVFKIDRSEWNVRHKSKSFFNGLKDQFIYDDMEVKIDIILNKE